MSVCCGNGGRSQNPELRRTPFHWLAKRLAIYISEAASLGGVMVDWTCWNCNCENSPADAECICCGIPFREQSAARREVLALEAARQAEGANMDRVASADSDSGELAPVSARGIRGKRWAFWALIVSSFAALPRFLVALAAGDEEKAIAFSLGALLIIPLTLFAYLIGWSTARPIDWGRIFRAVSRWRDGIHTRRRCPYCAEYVKAEAIRCKHCRSDI